ncbi:MAG: RNA methyltransferase [Oscillospiraceae bacterium]|nr:RNA methyltransferase [Oscillospiraceae bacterium]
MPQNEIFLQPGTANQTVRSFRHLNRSRIYREKQRLFAMEGSRLIFDALRSGVKLRAVMLTAHAKDVLGERLAAEAPGVRTLMLSDALADEIADTESAQGIFAVAEMCPEQVLSPEAGMHAVLLHCVQDPANLGAVLRTAEALGTDGVFLYQCVDLYNPKTLRSSMGALFRLPLLKISDAEAFLADCGAAGLPTCAAVVDRDALPLQQFDFSGGAAVLIGNEGNGLPRSISDACTHRLTIPMAPDSNSLNAAMAAGLFLWEMQRGNLSHE